MTKKEIRSGYLKLRLALSEEKYASLNQGLCTHFFSSVDLSRIQTLHTFLPILSKREPNTWLIVKKLRKDFSEIRISIPRIENNRMVNFYFEGENQLKKNQWEIPEPVSGIATPTEKIDLVIVPLLAFDKKGNRVGYGKGFYDRFLSECRTDCKKIGLSFFGSLSDLIQAEQFDIPLDEVITPEGIVQT